MTLQTNPKSIPESISPIKPKQEEEEESKYEDEFDGNLLKSTPHKPLFTSYSANDVNDRFEATYSKILSDKEESQFYGLLLSHHDNNYEIPSLRDKENKSRFNKLYDSDESKMEHKSGMDIVEACNYKSNLILIIQTEPDCVFVIYLHKTITSTLKFDLDLNLQCSYNDNLKLMRKKQNAYFLLRSEVNDKYLARWPRDLSQFWKENSSLIVDEVFETYFEFTIKEKRYKLEVEHFEIYQIL